MKYVRVNCEVHEGEVKDFIGYEEKIGNIIFDIKLGKNFRLMVRYVGEGSNATTPASITHS